VQAILLGALNAASQRCPGRGQGMETASVAQVITGATCVLCALGQPSLRSMFHGQYRGAMGSTGNSVFPCIWPASVYSVRGVVAVSVRIFATLARGDIEAIATDAHRHRYSRLKSDTPEKYSFPRNNLACESPQGGSHNPLRRITAKGFPLHSLALPASG
jgi:hypothetical protein